MTILLRKVLVDFVAYLFYFSVFKYQKHVRWLFWFKDGKLFNFGREGENWQYVETSWSERYLFSCLNCVSEIDEDMFVICNVSLYCPTTVPSHTIVMQSNSSIKTGKNRGHERLVNYYWSEKSRLNFYQASGPTSFA